MKQHHISRLWPHRSHLSVFLEESHVHPFRPGPSCSITYAYITDRHRTFSFVLHAPQPTSITSIILYYWQFLNPKFVLYLIHSNFANLGQSYFIMSNQTFLRLPVQTFVFMIIVVCRGRAQTLSPEICLLRPPSHLTLAKTKSWF